MNLEKIREEREKWFEWKDNKVKKFLVDNTPKHTKSRI